MKTYINNKKRSTVLYKTLCKMHEDGMYLVVFSDLCFLVEARDIDSFSEDIYEEYRKVWRKQPFTGLGDWKYKRGRKYFNWRDGGNVFRITKVFPTKYMTRKLLDIENQLKGVILT